MSLSIVYVKWDSNSIPGDTRHTYIKTELNEASRTFAPLPPTTMPRGHFSPPTSDRGPLRRGPPPTVQRECKFFKLGTCRFGQRCKFLHVLDIVPDPNDEACNVSLERCEESDCTKPKLLDTIFGFTEWVKRRISSPERLVDRVRRN